MWEFYLERLKLPKIGSTRSPPPFSQHILSWHFRFVFSNIAIFSDWKMAARHTHSNLLAGFQMKCQWIQWFSMYEVEEFGGCKPMIHIKNWKFFFRPNVWISRFVPISRISDTKIFQCVNPIWANLCIYQVNASYFPHFTYVFFFLSGWCCGVGGWESGNGILLKIRCYQKAHKFGNFSMTINNI